MKRILIAALVVACATAAQAQGLPIKGGASADLANVNTKKAMEVAQGQSSKATYIATSGALVTTALYSMQLEAPAVGTVYIHRICVGVTNATAAAGVTVTVNRRSTAGSGGTTLTAEGTGADAVSKLDPADSNFGGIARRTPTLGTIGATLDQWGFQVGELAAGTADVPGQPQQCQVYGLNGGTKPIVISAGTANGVSVSVSAPGAGGLAFGSISIMFTVE